VIAAFKRWLADQSRRAERAAFQRGYEFGKNALDHGAYTKDALEALADGSFNTSAAQDAFDRGIRYAAADARAEGAGHA
jgi:hypothetical protein